MDEFLKLNWGIDDLSALEKQPGFIKEEVLVNSLIYKNFQNPLRKPKKINLSIPKKKIIPGEKFFFRYGEKSLLDNWQQEHCLTALKIIQSGKDHSKLTKSETFSLKIYNELKQVIFEENRKYLNFALNEWENETFKNNLNNVRAGVYFHCKDSWNFQCKRFLQYSRYYKEKSTFNMGFTENECTIEFKCVQNALELGTLARYSEPNLKVQCVLKCVNLPTVAKTPDYHSQLPVSQDENIKKILQTQILDVVISAGGLKRLTDNTDPKIKWTLPIIVKEVDVKLGNGNILKKKVVFIDKPLPQTNPNVLELSSGGFKKLLKTSFCQYEAFTFPTLDIPVVHSEEIKKPVLNQITNDLNEMQKEILSDGADAISAEESKQNEPKGYNGHKRFQNTIHHNANYKIWNIKRIDEQNNLMKNKSKNMEINILVRSKLDACKKTDEGPLLPVILKPKLERQLCFGANIPSKSELAREWTSLFFTPYSTLYRARMHPCKSEVITVEKCPIQKVVSEALIHHQFKPHLGLGVLQKVFNELLKLEPGNYLLQHQAKHGSFVAILKECSESSPDCFDLHAEYEKCSMEPSITQNWLPLDTNYILPIFEEHKRMPCMFLAMEKKIWTKKKKGNKKGVKRKAEELTVIKNESK